MKRVGIVISVFAVLALAGAVALPRLVDADSFRPLLQSKLSAALGRNVTIGSLELSILSGGVTANDVSVADEVHAQSVQVQVKLKPLIFSHQLDVTGVTVVKPEVRLAIGATRAPSAPPRMQIGLFRVTDGRITLLFPEGHAAPFVLDKVSIGMKDVSTAGAMPLTLGANLPDGAAIRVTGTGMPLKADLHAERVDLLKAGLVDAETGIEGVATIDASVADEAGVPVVKGKIRIERLKLAKNGTPASKPVDVDFDLGNNELTKCEIRVGSAAIDVSGQYDAGGKTPVIHMKTAGVRLPAADLAALLPAVGVVLPKGVSIDKGTVSFAIAIDGAADSPVIAGKLSVNEARLANYDLGTKLKVLGELAGIRVSRDTEIQSLSANVRVATNGTTLDAIRVVAPSIGELTGRGTVDAARTLDFRMRLTRGALGAIPFVIEGTPDNPTFRPDMKTFASDKAHDLTKEAASAERRLTGLVVRKPKK